MYKPPGGTGPIVGSVGGLAVTGWDVALWIAFGAALLVTGLFLLRIAGRRRTATRSDLGEGRRDR